MHLTKHHGLANDFLVVLDEASDGVPVIDGTTARRLCHRRTGIGADGLIRGETPAEAPHLDVVMHLYNSDGSRAEMSGNGARCLAHAIALARGDGAGTSYTFATDGGERTARIIAIEGNVALVSISMGPANPGPAVPGPLAEGLPGRHLTLDFGNPHLVIEVEDPAAVDLETEGPWLEQQFPHGVNVEYVHLADDGVLDMGVWERGAGVTEACGTGACAAAHAAHEWGLVGETVSVRMPGGTAEVDLGQDIVLKGPSVLVAHIEVADG